MAGVISSDLQVGEGVSRAVGVIAKKVGAVPGKSISVVGGGGHGVLIINYKMTHKQLNS